MTLGNQKTHPRGSWGAEPTISSCACSLLLSSPVRFSRPYSTASGLRSILPFASSQSPSSLSPVLYNVMLIQSQASLTTVRYILPPSRAQGLIPLRQHVSALDSRRIAWNFETWFCCEGISTSDLQAIYWEKLGKEIQLQDNNLYENSVLLLQRLVMS